MEKQFLRSLLLLPPSLEVCHTPSLQPDRISATAPLSYSWWTTTPDETQLYYNSSCWQNTIHHIQRLGSPSRITATVLGCICSKLLPAKSLRNLWATLLPHDRNNWTGIAVAQPHTIQLSQLTPATGTALGLIEQHGVGAVLDSLDGKKTWWKDREERKERIRVVMWLWCDSLGCALHSIVWYLPWQEYEVS